MTRPPFDRVAHRPFPPPSGAWIGRQQWHDLLFAHWPVAASLVRPLVPSALRIDEFEGTSWISLVPFLMKDVMLRGIPAIPGLSAFPEMNLRLYVEYQGQPGIWFVSLDASNLAAVWTARRFARLPYFHASMRVRSQDNRVIYESARLKGADVVFRGCYWPIGAPREAAPGTLDYFLAERYALFTEGPGGEMLTIGVHHGPWSLQAATVEIDFNTVMTGQGIAVSGPPALAHFSRRQDVLTWPVRRA
jgi:uncharacterized protein YqjF (DUF2071 family)